MYLLFVPTDNTAKESSFAAGERMHELVKVCAYLSNLHPEHTLFFQVQIGTKKLNTWDSQFWFFTDFVPLDGEELFVVFFPV